MQRVSNRSSLDVARFLASDKDSCCSRALAERTSVHGISKETNKLVNTQADKHINQSACC